MIICRKYATYRDLVTALNGTKIAVGTAGTTTAGGTTLTSGIPGAFANVEVGDQVYISGEATSKSFDVTVVTDTVLTLGDTTANAVTVAAVYVITRDRLDTTAILFSGPIMGSNGDDLLLFMDVPDFAASPLVS